MVSDCENNAINVTSEAFSSLIISEGEALHEPNVSDLKDKTITTTHEVPPSTAPVAATASIAPAVTTSSFDASNTAYNEFLAVLPVQETTDAGNRVFTLSGLDIDDEQLFAVLDECNSSVSNGTPAEAWPAAVYSERSDEAQNQFNFFNPVINDDGPLKTDQQTMQRMQVSFDADVHGTRQ